MTAPNRLRITEAQFDELYPDLAGQYGFFNNPVPAGISTTEFERTYLRSKLWRLNNCYTIVGKGGKPCIFRMNYAQHRVYARTREHPRVIILKSRQQGISTLWLVSYFDDATFQPHLNLGLMAQGTDEAATLLERAKFLWDMLDPSIKQFLGIRLVKDNTKEFAFSNESTIFIRVSFRSTTLQRLHISEFGKIANANPKRAKETKTGTLQALARGMTGVIESTAEGKNMFKTMWDDSILALHSGQLSAKDFYPEFLPWVDDPDCVETVPQTIDDEAATYFAELETKLGRVLADEQKWFWVVQRRELGGDIFQEYPATPEEAFTASRDSTYYSRKFNEVVVRGNRVVTELYDPNLPVEVYCDLGVDDYFVMGFFQKYRGRYRIIDEYYNDGYDITHYMDEAWERYGDNIGHFHFPHDIAVRELGNKDHHGRAKSRLDIARDHVRESRRRAVCTKQPKSSIADGIEATRLMVDDLWIDARCVYLIDCFNNYSKDWDDKMQQWKTSPLHDEYSHGADVLRAMAVSVINANKHVNDSRPVRKKRGPSVAV